MAEEWKIPQAEDENVPAENEEFRGRADEDDEFEDTDDLDEEEDDEDSTTF